MRKKLSAIVLSASGAFLALAVALPSSGPPTRAGEAQKEKAEAKHDAGAAHGELFQTTAKPQRRSIRDPRLRVTELEYTPVKRVLQIEKEAPGEIEVVVQGDIVLGTEEELDTREIAYLNLLARAINPNAASVGLSAPQKQAIEQVKDLGQEIESPSAAVANRVAAGTVLAQASRLGARAATEKKAYLQGVGKATEAVREEVMKNRPKAAPQPRAEARKDEDPLPAVGDDRSALILNASTVTTVGGFLWPHGVIAYEFHPTIPAGPRRDQVNEAIKKWNDATKNVHLFARTNANANKFPNWIVFADDGRGVCQARVGKRPTPGAQAVILGPGCGEPQAIHEIGHIIGLWHEQMRNDRDSFLRIRFDRIDPSTISNFEKIGLSGFDFETFDFGSIMLYPPRSFTAVPGLPTMERRDGGTADFGIFTPGVGGVTRTMSPQDIRGVESLYLTPAPQTEADIPNLQ